VKHFQTKKIETSATIHDTVGEFVPYAYFEPAVQVTLSLKFEIADGIVFDTGGESLLG